MLPERPLRLLNWPSASSLCHLLHSSCASVLVLASLLVAGRLDFSSAGTQPDGSKMEASASSPAVAQTAGADSHMQDKKAGKRGLLGSTVSKKVLESLETVKAVKIPQGVIRPKAEQDMVGFGFREIMGLKAHNMHYPSADTQMVSKQESWQQRPHSLSVARLPLLLAGLSGVDSSVDTSAASVRCVGSRWTEALVHHLAGEIKQ